MRPVTAALTCLFMAGLIATPGHAAPLLSAAERKQILTYQDDSDRLRREKIALMQTPPSSDRDARLKALSAGIRELDDAALPVAERAVRNGFFKRLKHRNDQLDSAVWLVTQHAFRPEIVDIMLPQLRVLVAQHLFLAENYAASYDRRQVLAGQPQIYGTQLACTDGRWQPVTIVDEVHLDARRRDIGMRETEAQFLTDYKDMVCVSPPKASP